MKSNLILQDIVLNQVRRDKEPVITIFNNGDKIEGVVRGFDNFTIIFDMFNGTQVVAYKHSISSICVKTPVLTDEKHQLAKRNEAES